MRVYEGGGLGDIYFEILRDLVEQGREVLVRGHRCVEFEEPVTLVYKSPGACWMTIPGRQFNPFFAAAEVLWILSGHGNVDWICQFNSNMRQFADEGKPEFHGAYGLRIRRWCRDHGANHWVEPIDQIKEVIRKLNEDPYTRQAVISLWDPVRDNVTKSRDFPCFAGDTQLWSPEGDFPISKVASKFKNGEIKKWPVYSVDPKTGKLKLVWATNVWKSGLKKVLKLTFDDGSFLKLTKDHKLYKREKQSEGKRCTSALDQKVDVDAGDLKVGDRIWATQKWYGIKGHEWVKRDLNLNTRYSNRQFVHRAYSELVSGPLPKNWDVHHDNEIKTDNRIKNLVRMDYGIHASLKMFGDRNSVNNFTKKQRRDWNRKHSEALTGRKYNVRNHKIVKIEQLPEESVYDFTVPGYHTALVGTGIVAHNCNNVVYYALRAGKLHQTVVIRSNDLVWGTPYNAVQFTHLHALIAGELRVRMGDFTYVIQNLHYYAELYPATLSPLIEKAWLGDPIGSQKHELFEPFHLEDVEHAWIYLNKLLKKQPAESWASLKGSYLGGVLLNLLALYIDSKDSIVHEFSEASAIEDQANVLKALGQPFLGLVRDFWSNSNKPQVKLLLELCTDG